MWADKWWLLLWLVVGGTMAQQSQVVYNGTTGKLTTGWNNWSWAKVSLNSTAVVPPGENYSIAMVCVGWQGLYLSQSEAWDISSYNTLSFWVNGGANPSSLVITVQLTAANNSANLQVSDYLPNHSFSSSWVMVEIPISHFSLLSSSVRGFWFQGNSDGETAYFDNIQFSLTKVPPIRGPSLTVDASFPKIPITPLIYGVTYFWNDNNEEFTSFAKLVKLPLNRNGGDATTRYNWMVDSSNAGFDWYFMGGNGQNTTVPGASVDSFIDLNANLGIISTITIPMIEYVNKMYATHCSFPENVYPNQQSYNPYVHPNGTNCGNGKNSTGGDIIDNDPLATDILNTPELQAAWIQHIVSKFGNSSQSGIIYQLDNEVSNWPYMHRDVHPQPVTYAEIVNQTFIYAAAVKKADPTAKVAAPSEIQFGWYPDWGATKNVIYFLQQMQMYEQKTGLRILDTYDAHYPDTGDNHWPVLNDVDRLKQVIDETYPGTGLSFSEWTMAGIGPLDGTLAVADQLGHFARNGVAWASLWGLDFTTSVTFAFQIFRNYDGKGSQFGDVYVNSTTANDGTLSLHSALRSNDNALTILVINKIANDQNSTLTLANFSGQAAQVFQYSSNNLTAIIQAPNLAVSPSGFTTIFAAFSLTMVVVPHA